MAELTSLGEAIDRGVCDLCGRPWGQHSVPINRLERLRGLDPPDPPVARFAGVPVVGLLCPAEAWAAQLDAGTALADIAAGVGLTRERVRQRLAWAFGTSVRADGLPKDGRSWADHDRL